MAVIRAKGPRGKADKLFSQLVRSRGVCVGCGERDYTKLQTCHVIPRRFSAVRTDLDNALCGCWRCHRRWTDHPDEWMDFVDSHLGRKEYRRLKAKAEAGGRFGKQFWDAEVLRLQALLKEAA